MSSRHKGRHAVYLGKLPTDYRPESPIDLPDRLSTLEVLEANLTMCQAIALTRFHNREQLAANTAPVSAYCSGTSCRRRAHSGHSA